MREITAGMFTSLDGVVQADDDWQFRWFDEELFAGVTAAWDRSDVAVMGRRSYEGYRSLRTEHPDSPMLGFLERVDRYVLSRTMVDPRWPGTTVIADDAFGRIAELHELPGDAPILVSGSPSVVRGLLARGLLDELTLTLLPIVVGPGDRLFPEGCDDGLQRRPLTLTRHRILRSGATELTYRPEPDSRV